MVGIQTNNFVESWHSILKMKYLQGFRKQRTDILVYRLLREVLPDLRLKVARILRGFERRRFTDVEQKQLQKCDDISNESASLMVKRSIAPTEGDEYVEIITVRSFENENIHYTVSLNASSSICECNCPYMTNTKVVCKHMFLAERQLGYSICFKTRSQDIIPEAEENLLPETILSQDVDDLAVSLRARKIISILKEIRELLLEQPESTRANASDLDYQLLADVNKWIGLKEDIHETSWSKRQRR